MPGPPVTCAGPSTTPGSATFRCEGCRNTRQAAKGFSKMSRSSSDAVTSAIRARLCRIAVSKSCVSTGCVAAWRAGATMSCHTSSTVQPSARYWSTSRWSCGSSGAKTSSCSLSTSDRACRSVSASMPSAFRSPSENFSNSRAFGEVCATRSYAGVISSRVAASRISTARVTVLIVDFCFLAQAIALSCCMTRSRTKVSPVVGARTTPRQNRSMRIVRICLSRGFCRLSSFSPGSLKSWSRLSRSNFSQASSTPFLTGGWSLGSSAKKPMSKASCGMERS
ncbi:hypothetical protein SHIRM173S_12286 [Streptomyces hirsutus]